MPQQFSRSASDLRSRGAEVGPFAQRIEAVRIGGLVWAWDTAVRRLVKRRVQRLYRHSAKTIVRVTLQGQFRQETIETTSEHPFWVTGQGWTPASGLRAGDQLQGLCNRDRPAVRALQTAQPAAVFNFEVAGDHNYFVGTAGVLVHNMSDLQVGVPVMVRNDLAGERLAVVPTDIRKINGQVIFAIEDSAAFRRLHWLAKRDMARAAAQKGKSDLSAAVYVGTVDYYDNKMKYVSDDGRCGIAIGRTPANMGYMGSLFSSPMRPGGSPLNSLFKTAIALGGDHGLFLDTGLPDLYSRFGMQPIAKAPFPQGHFDGWDEKAFARWNAGRPDIVGGVIGFNQVLPYSLVGHTIPAVANVHDLHKLVFHAAQQQREQALKQGRP